LIRLDEKAKRGEMPTELVQKKVRECFPQNQWEDVFAEFRANGIGDERTQLAVIKLSAGEIAELRKFIDIARMDPRDVFAYAEYPEEFGSATWKLDPERVREIRERDRQQYLDWLKTR
jgi:hypothetical protein